MQGVMRCSPDQRTEALPHPPSHSRKHPMKNPNPVCHRLTGALASHGRTSGHREGFPRRYRDLRWVWLAIAGAGLVVTPVSRAEQSSDDVVAVFSSVSPFYTRTPQPGGGFKPETYAFGEGGSQSSQKDLSLDQLKFMDVARTVAPQLAARGYLPCSKTDATKTDLLIMVYWGSTVGTDNTSSSSQYQIAQSFVPPPPAPFSPVPTPSSAAEGMVADPSTSGRSEEAAIASVLKAEADSALQQSMLIANSANRMRDRQDTENASILGYVHEMKRVEGFQLSAALKQRRQDVLDEIEESRYYVVLMAYDFQELLKNKQKKLLWETRFSIRQHRNDFGKELAAMVESAARYFGEDSHGLKRKSLREEHINLGELKIIQVEPEKK